MLPLGYVYKQIYLAPAGFGPAHVRDVYAASACLSSEFDESLEVRIKNEHTLHDSPDEIRAMAAEHALTLAGFTLFYFEAHELEYVQDEHGSHWRKFPTEPPEAWTVEPPHGHSLEGFDIVAMGGTESPGCSPLSCNRLVEEIATNEHCLLPSLEAAIHALESGAFVNAEPGPYRIFAVYTLGSD